MSLLNSCLMPVYDRFAVSLVSGAGPYVNDSKGVQYIDFASGVAVNCLGHTPYAPTEALTKQAMRLWHVSNLYQNPLAQELAEDLCGRTFAAMAFFCNSGAEAVECGIKAMRRYHYMNGDKHRTKIITFQGAFHGRTLATLAAAGNEKYLEGFGVPLDGFVHLPFGDHDALKNAIQADDIAGVLIEPVQGEGGVRVVPDQCLDAIKALCVQYGALLMLDEVQTGIGRTGRLFAYQHTSIKPDILATAKGLGAGFPLGACLTTERVGKAMTPGSHGNTFGGNHLACAVGLAVLNEVGNEFFLERLAQASEHLLYWLNKLAADYPQYIKEVRGRGLLLGLKLHEPLTPRILATALIDQQLLTAPAGDNVLRLLPSLNVFSLDIEKAAERLDRAFATIHTYLPAS